jgi:hypothetical protein
MKLQKILLLKLIVVIVTLLIIHPGFSQVKREEAISFSGSIDNIPKDSKFIVVNERRVFISSNTKITNAKGSILKRSDLKIGLGVTVEGVQKPEGIFAEKITVLATPKIRP